jgi:hypothetical protein
LPRIAVEPAVALGIAPAITLAIKRPPIPLTTIALEIAAS